MEPQVPGTEEDTNIKLPNTKTKFSWVIWLVVAVGIWIVIAHFNDIKNIANILTEGSWQLVGLAAVFQFFSYLLYARMYQAAFATVGIRAHTWRNLVTYLESLLPSIVIPAGNIAFFLRSIRQSEQSATNATVALVFVRITDLISFCLLFLVGLAYSAFSGRVQGFEVISAEILLALSIILIGGLLISAYQPVVLERLLSWFGSLVNFFASTFSKKTIIAKDWGLKNAQRFSDAAQELIAHRTDAGQAFLLALATHLLDLLTVFILFLAFRQSVNLGTLLVGFVIGMFFVLIPITPQGIGAVEGVMILAYSRLGVPVEAATVAVLAFRGLSFWLPAIIGLVLFQGHNLLSRKRG